jgi:hypothetical protein
LPGAHDAPPFTRIALLLIPTTGNHATTLTLLAIRDVHGPTLPPKVSPLASHAQLIIKAVLVEITITGNLA